jgi:subtilisin family serine protease
MAKRASRKRPAGAAPPAAKDVSGTFTGRVLVLFREKANHKSVFDALGLKLVRAADFKDSAVRMADISSADGIVYDEIGVGVMSLAPDQHSKLQTISAASDSNILASEPERIMYAINSNEYWRGYRDGVTSTVDRLLGGRGAQGSERLAQVYDESRATWGLQATRVVNSKFTGKGVGLCVLDTGIDLTHPDFQGRAIISQSFISGVATVQDGAGHGTHTAGTACGPATPPILPRYGVASGSNMYIGKVLSDQGSGGDSSILAGINWAIANKCSIVSMSLEAPVEPGEQPSPVYEAVGERALAANTLIIAAAGNDSRRPESISPVGRPANCKSIMAVAAVDQNLAVAFFSNGSINPNGGAIDIAGPGIDVRSSWPMPQRYNTINGTSMATPHVSGIAALWLEAQRVTASMLWNKLTQSARRLSASSSDVGSGLVQAP